MNKNIRRHRGRRHLACLLLCLFIIAGCFEPAFILTSAQTSTGDTYESAQTKAVEEEVLESSEDGKTGSARSLSDYREISKVLTKDEDCFAAMTVDPSDAVIVKDGKEGTLEHEFNADSDEVEKAVSSEENMEEFLQKKDSDTIYEVETEKDGDFEITAPYQTRRLIIDGLIKKDTMGAAHVYYNTIDHETILEFDSDQKTRDAWETASKLYGENHCYVDELLHFEDLAHSTDDTIRIMEADRTVSWGNSYMGMNDLKTKAAAYGYNREVKVAVIDSGINRSHPMFSGGRIHGQSWNFAMGSSDYSDNIGHGSHVSGIIADATPSNVKIVMLKVTTGNKDIGSIYDIKNALRYAVARDVQVINISMGLNELDVKKQTILNDVVEKAWYKGIPICCSSGNDGVDVKYIYPANLSKTIAVGAFNYDGSRGNYVKGGRRIYYSDYGKKLDFSAPGTEVLSAGKGLYYVYMTGTSMACPHITAAVAYLKMMEPDISVSNVRKQLKSMCKDLGPKGRDKYFGWGCPMMKDLFAKGITYKGATAPAVGKVNVTGLKNGKKGVTISWKKAKKADKYKVYRKASGGYYKEIAVLSKGKRSYLDKKAKQGKKYIYKVRAFHSSIGGENSDEKVIVCLKTITGIKAAKKSKTSVTLKWKKRKSVTDYQIRYSSGPSMKKNETITVNKTRKKITGLKGKYIYYQIRAMKTMDGSTCYSAWSARKKVKLR